MKYKIIYQQNGKIRTKIVITNSLEEEILPSNIISIKKDFLSFDFEISKKISERDLKNIFYELNLMLNSKILLDEAFDILIKKEKNRNKKEFLKTLQNSFICSDDMYKSLEKYNISNVVKAFLKITKDRGNPILNINSLSKIIADNYEIKKELLKALTYPIILLLTFFISLIGIYKVVVPNFKSIFLHSDIPLSSATKLLFWTKDVFDDYLFFISSIFFLILVVLIFLYKKNSYFRYKLDKIFVKNIFILSSLYRMKNLYIFFLVIETLLKSKYEFLDAVSKAKVLLNNKYLFDRITQIENLLKSGKSISFAFESSKLFDDVTLSLLKIAEVSNSTQSVVCEIKNIYKKRFDDKIKFFSLLIEPLFFIIIMVLIVWIILAIFVPLWSMHDMLRF